MNGKGNCTIYYWIPEPAALSKKQRKAHKHPGLTRILARVVRAFTKTGLIARLQVLCQSVWHEIVFTGETRVKGNGRKGAGGGRG